MSNTLGKLYIVATPIGNLADMILEALDLAESFEDGE